MLSSASRTAPAYRPTARSRKNGDGLYRVSLAKDSPFEHAFLGQDTAAAHGVFEALNREQLLSRTEPHLHDIM
jgi:hypothetical protein